MNLILGARWTCHLLPLEQSHVTCLICAAKDAAVKNWLEECTWLMGPGWCNTPHTAALACFYVSTCKTHHSKFCLLWGHPTSGRNITDPSQLRWDSCLHKLLIMEMKKEQRLSLLGILICIGLTVDSVYEANIILCHLDSPKLMRYFLGSQLYSASSWPQSCVMHELVAAHATRWRHLRKMFLLDIIFKPSHPFSLDP
jgi:hypothetical protein